MSVMRRTVTRGLPSVLLLLRFNATDCATKILKKAM